jgi:hypothetical protein
LRTPVYAAYRPTYGLKNAILQGNFEKFPFASEDFASGIVYLALIIAILKPGIVIPGSRIAIPGFGNAILSLGIAIPCPRIVISGLGIVISGLRIVIPKPGIALPGLSIAILRPSIVILILSAAMS